MNEPITKPVMVCQECYDVDCRIHNDLKRAVQCLICKDTHETLKQANDCCYPMTDHSIVGASGLAKVPKPKRNVELEYPTRALQGERDK